MLGGFGTFVRSLRILITSKVHIRNRLLTISYFRNFLACLILVTLDIRELIH
jgi:hypothetical protein